jgi:hypothetical protein
MPFARSVFSAIAVLRVANSAFCTMIPANANCR